MRHTKRSYLIMGLLIVLFLIGACGKPEKPHAFNWKVSDFNFTDEHGQAFGLNDLKGKVWIADFEFTHCDTVCSPMTMNLVTLQNKLKKSHVPVQFVTFTVDPERDTPEALKTFALKHKGDLSHWHLLTGYSFNDIKTLSEHSFKSALAKPIKGSDQFTHGTSFYLIDQKGVIVQKYHGYSDTPYDQIVKDAKALND